MALWIRQFREVFTNNRFEIGQIQFSLVFYVCFNIPICKLAYILNFCVIANLEAIWIWKNLVWGFPLWNVFITNTYICGVLHLSFDWMELPAKVLKELVQIPSSITLIYQFEFIHLWMQNIFVRGFLIAFTLLYWYLCPAHVSSQ